MRRQDFNRHWDFFLENKYEGKVNLPHDYSIIQKRNPDCLSGGGNGYFPGGTAEYRKIFTAPSEWKGKTAILEFEGVYMNAVVRLNGNIIGRHPYGYTTFHCELSPYLLYDSENELSVSVNNSALPNTRWYSGSGIYRPVWLMVGEAVHIKPWGVFSAAKKTAEKESVLSVKTEVENRSSADAEVAIRTTIIDDAGNYVGVKEENALIPGKENAEIEQLLTISPARLWSVDDPYLYTIKIEVIKDGRIIDEAVLQTGIRSVSFDSSHGFRLNGVQMKLKGGNVHHDCGILGARAFARAEERKAELLKANGFNAVRCAHNPPSPAFLDACDRIGLLVMDEAFDVWNEGKVANDYSLYFSEWWKKDLDSMIRRDRNHPSIIMWSTGNEIGERDGRSDGYKYAAELAEFVRKLDNTRAVTNGICWVAELRCSPIGVNMLTAPKEFDYWGKATESFAQPLDVVGYNYWFSRYKEDAVKYPERVICGTESYLWDSLKYGDSMEEYPNVIGDFYWTALDYLGEVGVGNVRYGGETEVIGYPWHVAFCGDIDICGFKRPQSYFRDCVWGLAEEPYIAVYKPQFYGKNPVLWGWSWPDVTASWDWPGYEGKPTAAEIYSTDDEVELFLNGKSLGRKPAGKANGYRALFELIYEPGELAAAGYRNGEETSRHILRTPGKAAGIRLIPDRIKLKAAYGDLSYITVEIVDSMGNVVYNAENKIFFSVCGAGSLIAVGSSNPVSEEMYTGNERCAYEGRAMAVVCTDGKVGEIVVTVMAEGLPAARTVLEAEQP